MLRTSGGISATTEIQQPWENLLARLTRHEILKEDRFMMLVDETRHFFANNRSEILRGLSAVGVVAALVAGYYYYTAKQEEQSKEELARALATYHATVGKTESSGLRLRFSLRRPLRNMNRPCRSSSRSSPGTTPGQPAR